MKYLVGMQKYKKAALYTCKSSATGQQQKSIYSQTETMILPKVTNGK